MKRRDHYRGSVARRYEQSRRGRLWDREQEAVRDIVAAWKEGERVLDVPVGTGRFLPIYEAHGMQATGVDVSPDMLSEARRKGTSAELREGDVFALPFEDGAFDRAVCFRLLNWMALDEAERALREIGRVTSGTVHLSVTVLIGPPRRSVARIIHEPEAFLAGVAAAGFEVQDTTVLREHRSHRYQVVEVQ